MSVVEIVEAMQRRVGEERLMPLTMVVTGVAEELGIKEDAARRRILKAVEDGQLLRIKPDYDRSITLPGTEGMKEPLYAEGPSRFQNQAARGTYRAVPYEDLSPRAYGLGSLTFVTTPADAEAAARMALEVVARKAADAEAKRERQNQELRADAEKSRRENWAETEKRRPKLHRQLTRLAAYLGSESDISPTPLRYSERAVHVAIHVDYRGANKLARLIRLGLDAVEAEEKAKEEAEGGAQGA